MAKHDQFFSRSLEHLDLAKQFIKIHLPVHFKHLIDIENISRLDRTNTDRSLSKHHRDIIYLVPLKTGGSLIVAIEHQSSEDKTITIRYLRYTVDNLEAWTNEGREQWPILVNLLLYHGKSSPYPYPCDSTGLYKDPLLGNQELYLRFHVTDLGQVGDEEILTHGLIAPLEILLKHSKDGALELAVRDYQNVFKVCINTLGNDYLLSMLEYVNSIEDIEVGKKLHKFLKEVLENKNDIIMTYGQFLGQEFKEEGIAIGVLKGVKQGIEIGRGEGIEIGRGEGIEIGRGEGIEIGKGEGILTKAIAVAKNMLLKFNLDIDTVQRTPGEAWLSKRVKFPSGQGIANQPELSVAA